MKIYLSKRFLIKTIIGTIYDMAPANNPRNIDKILDYIKKYCNENIRDYITSIDPKNLRKYIKTMMFDCKEFTQLNISQKLWDEGIRDYDDSKNRGISITSIEHNEKGEVISISENEYCDFIDLDACVDNIVSDIKSALMYKEDCFLCKYAKKYMSMEPSECEQCNNCNINPKYKHNKETHPKALLPRNSEEYKNLS